jgi:hypothetical protein
MSAFNKLQQAGKESLKKLERLTFNVNEVEIKPTKNGNVGYRVKASNGEYLTFWDTTMANTVEDVVGSPDVMQVKLGVQLAKDQFGDFSLIPADKVSKGFWSK